MSVIRIETCFVIGVMLYVHQHSNDAGKESAKKAADTVTNYVIHQIFGQRADEIIQ
jgi:hypothetical protein